MNELGITLITTLISSVFSSGVISIIVSAVIKGIEAKDTSKKCAKEADKLLLLDLLTRTAQKHIEAGQITQTQYDIFEATYKCYKACDGDGWADGVKQEINNLPKVL